MSILLEIKNLIVSHLNMSPDLKGAVMGVLNNIDTDLDINGYENCISDNTEDSLRYLEQVLSGISEENEEDELSETDNNIVLERKKIRPVINEEEDVKQ